MIPRNIIQFWHDLNNVPDVIAEAMRSTESNNNNYTVIKADDSFMHEFIEQKYNKSILAIYKENKIAASRSDIARLMLLYEYGGFYIDASIEIVKSLDEIYDDRSEIIVVQRDDLATYKNCPERALYINGFIAVSRKSDFIKTCIDQIVINLITGNYNTRVNLATGPRIINQTLIMYKNLNIKRLSFSSLSGVFFISRRVQGVSNDWVCSQSNGILPSAFYEKSVRRFRKLWLGRRVIIHLSFSIFFMRNY